MHDAEAPPAHPRRAWARVFGPSDRVAVVSRVLEAARWEVDPTASSRWPWSLRDWLETHDAQDTLLVVIVETQAEVCVALEQLDASRVRSRPLLVLLAGEVSSPAVARDVLDSDVDDVVRWEDVACLSARLERCLAQLELEVELTRLMADRLEHLANLQQLHRLGLKGKLATLAGGELLEHLAHIKAELGALASATDPTARERTLIDTSKAIQRASQIACHLSTALPPTASSTDESPTELVALIERLRTPLTSLVGVDVTVTSELDAVHLGIDAGLVTQIVTQLVLERRAAHPAQQRIEIALTDTSRRCVRISVDGPAPADEARIGPPGSASASPVDASFELCQLLVTAFDGRLEVYDDDACGHRLEVAIPVMEAQPGQDTCSPTVTGARDSAAPRQRTSAQTVLLVEDQPALSRLMVRMLRQRGFELLVAGSAEQALELWSTHADEVHLLVADRRLPGMSGDALGARLREVCPGLPILFISGQTREPPEVALAAPDITAMLPKPFSGSDLTATIQALLESIE